MAGKRANQPGYVAKKDINGRTYWAPVDKGMPSSIGHAPSVSDTISTMMNPAEEVQYTVPKDQVFSIIETRFDKTEKKLNRIKSKCEKYGNDFHYEKLGEEYKTVMVNGEKKKAKFIKIKAYGTAIINGWEFAASLENTGEGNLIKGVGIELPEEFYDAEPKCDHCQVNHKRKYSYVVRNTESGEFKQVGKSCLQEFTNGMDAGLVSEMADFLSNLEEQNDKTDFEFYSGERVEHHYTINDFLKYASETIRVYGYEGARETGQKAALFNDYYDGMLMGRQKYAVESMIKESNFNPRNKESEKEVEAALKWLEEKNDNNNYFHNLKTIMKLEESTIKNVGLMASLIKAYQKDMDLETKRKEKNESDKSSSHIGEIKERVKIKIKEYRVLYSYQNRFGPGLAYELKDTEGNILIWKTGNRINEEGEFNLTATVKDHNVYKGINQTVVTRCKVS